MFEFFARLHHWLAANDITKPVTVILRTDAMTADRISYVLRDQFNKVCGGSSTEPIREGQLYGIRFKIEIAE
jgi:hypothetical protein